jgi:hypothetical protein
LSKKILMAREKTKKMNLENLTKSLQLHYNELTAEDAYKLGMFSGEIIQKILRTEQIELISLLSDKQFDTFIQVCYRYITEGYDLHVCAIGQADFKSIQAIIDHYIFTGMIPEEEEAETEKMLRRGQQSAQDKERKRKAEEEQTNKFQGFVSKLRLSNPDETT